MSLILLRWLINAATLLALTQLVDGFYVESIWYALIAALILGLVNAVIRPILFLLTLPITILTLGLFSFVINALMISFVASFVQGFAIDGFMTALFAAIVLWAVSLATNWLLKKSNRE